MSTTPPYRSQPGPLATREKKRKCNPCHGTHNSRAISSERPPPHRCSPESRWSVYDALNQSEDPVHSFTERSSIQSLSQTTSTRPHRPRHIFTMRGLAAVAALGLALLPTTFAQKKPFAIPDSLRWEMGNDLSSRMKAASVTKINRWSNAVPVACYQEGQKFVSGNSGRIQCELDQLTVFEAWFSDAQTPWVICRCKDTTTANPKYTEADLLAEIGKVPVAFRQYTRMFIGFGQSAGGKVAYSTWDKDIILMNMNTMNVMVTLPISIHQSLC